MLRRIWLFFAQACTLCVAALFVVSTLRPDLLPRPAAVRPGNVIVTQETTTPVVTARVASYADAAKKAMPAVVAIVTSKQVRSRVPARRRPAVPPLFPGPRPPGAAATDKLGSGVIVSPEGYVITNHHVIEGADDIQLALSDGGAFRRRCAAPTSKRISPCSRPTPITCPAITLGHAEDLQVGDVVLAIGNPYGFGGTGDIGHRERSGSKLPGPQPLRGLHPDRRRDQPRQFRRRPHRHGGQPDRHQQHDLFPVGSIERDRVLDSGLAGAQRV
jgi:serine protease DegQ